MAGATMLVMLFISLWMLREGAAMAATHVVLPPSISLLEEGNQRLGKTYQQLRIQEWTDEGVAHGIGIRANLPLYSTPKTCRWNSTHSHACGLHASPPCTQSRSVP